MQKHTATISFLFIMVIVLLRFMYTIKAFAQIQDRVITKVGNPLSGGDNVLKTAQDLLDTYKTCSGSIAYPLTKCAITKLQEKGYSNEIMRAYEKRGRGVGGCAQCLGYVSLALTLISGDEDTLSAGRGFGAAVDLLRYSAFQSGNLTYTKLDHKNIQPGDIGVSSPGPEGIGSNGHILIANQPQGNTKFTAYESSFGGPTCSIRNDYAHNKDFYTFYR